MEKLNALHTRGRFPSVSPEDIHRITEWIYSCPLQDWVSQPPILQHGDLNRSQILGEGESLRILDWQRPVYAPAGIDLTTLLRDCHLDPRQYVPPQAVRLERYLHLLWAVEAQHDLFPEVDGPWFDAWAFSAIKAILE